MGFRFDILDDVTGLDFKDSGLSKVFPRIGICIAGAAWLPHWRERWLTSWTKGLVDSHGT